MQLLEQAQRQAETQPQIDSQDARPDDEPLPLATQESALGEEEDDDWLDTLDLKLMPDVGTPRSASTRELRNLIEALRLPQPAARSMSARRTERDTAPVLARTVQSYREAMTSAMPAGIASCPVPVA